MAELKDLLLDEHLAWNLAKRGVKFERTAFVMWVAKDSVWRAENPRYSERNYCLAGQVPSSYVKREGNPRRPVVTNLPTLEELMDHYVVSYYTRYSSININTVDSAYCVENLSQHANIQGYSPDLITAVALWLINMIDYGAINVKEIEIAIQQQAT